MIYLFNFFYYIWKLYAPYAYQSNQAFLTTQNVPIREFLGSYIQLMRTPNFFQNTENATATYYEQNGTIKLINREFKEKKGVLEQSNAIDGYLENVDIGTYFVYFNNVSIPGIYRILKYEIHPIYGSYMLVSSVTPSTTWVLWKPRSQINNIIFDQAYNYGMEKIKWFSEIGYQYQDPNNDIIISNKKNVATELNILTNMLT